MPSRPRIHLRTAGFATVPDSKIRVGTSSCGRTLVQVTGDPSTVTCLSCRKALHGLGSTPSPTRPMPNPTVQITLRKGTPLQALRQLRRHLRLMHLPTTVVVHGPVTSEDGERFSCRHAPVYHVGTRWLSAFIDGEPVRFEPTEATQLTLRDPDADE